MKGNKDAMNIKMAHDQQSQLSTAGYQLYSVSELIFRAVSYIIIINETISIPL